MHRKYKHMTLDDLIEIQTGLNKGTNFKAIAKLAMIQEDLWKSIFCAAVH